MLFRKETALTKVYNKVESKIMGKDLPRKCSPSENWDCYTVYQTKSITTNTKQKDNLQNGRKYLQTKQPTRD